MNSIHDLCLVPDENKYVSSPERNLIKAMFWLYYLDHAGGIDDEIVDFARQDGWPRTGKLLLRVIKDRGGRLRLSGGWVYWVMRLHDLTDDLAVSGLPLFEDDN